MGVLNSLGFKATEKIVNSAVYWATIGNEANKAQIGFADWFQDYPHPLDWFDVLLNGQQDHEGVQQQLRELRRPVRERRDRRAQEPAPERRRRTASGPGSTRP